MPSTRSFPMHTVALVMALAGSTALAQPTPGAGQTAAGVPPVKRESRVLGYLQSISGKQTVAGIHNREPNAVPALQTNAIHDLTGTYPGLWSGDFLFKADDVNARWAMIYEARRQWEQGSIVQLMLHVAPPTLPEGSCPWQGGILSHLSDEQWSDLVTDGGALNKVWKSRLDEYATYLKYLQDYGVEVLFRPHHEMNQGLFWWGGRPGPDGTARLYRLTHDYLVGTKGLTNLIWVWDMQDLSRDLAAYDPGEAYWDVFAFDVYDQGYDRSWYESILPIAGDKPMAIGECAKLPTPELLAAQPRWVFFMSWAELTFTSNTPRQILDLYASPRVVTRERLPRFQGSRTEVNGAASASPPAADTTTRSSVQPADEPAPRDRDYPWMSRAEWWHRHEALVAIDAQTRRRARVVVLGDSIVQVWDDAVWNQLFGAYHPLRLGLGGDKTQNVLWRIEHGELDGTHPDLLVLLVGTNNIRTDGATPATISRGISRIVKTVRGKLPTARILVLAILPRGEQPGTPDREAITATNRLLAHLDDGRRVRVLDVGSRLLEPDGRISPETMADFLHPTPRGFHIIAEAMAPLLREMVGR